jgi:hypothetical protein
MPLTEEQRARIERNRQEALARRARMQDQPSQANPQTASSCMRDKGPTWESASHGAKAQQQQQQQQQQRNFLDQQQRRPHSYHPHQHPAPATAHWQPSGARSSHTFPASAGSDSVRGAASAPVAWCQKRISFAPLPTDHSDPSAAASHRPSLLAQNAANLRHDKEVQDRCRAAAAAARQQAKERQQQEQRPSVVGSSSNSGAASAPVGQDSRKKSTTQSLLVPKAASVSICPASELTRNAELGSGNPSSSGLDPELAKTLFLPSFGREYQRTIIQSAVLHNTLVSLPTGMGKTFVAAVVMFNYLRWFPDKIVVFLAPTKPLAKQQVDAVYSIVGIPKAMTVLMTGDVAPELRKDQWQVSPCCGTCHVVSVPCVMSS